MHNNPLTHFEGAQKKARMCINLFIFIPQFSHKLFDSSHLNVSVNVSELIALKL